ncbi:protein SSUH2 homolog [Mixophyes fleayi]|uniref:protein SSUH2 homolog n=1 Tax=Mixophyes fleayi TaxID=3061075 RepID=UPI003F4D9BD2
MNLSKVATRRYQMRMAVGEDQSDGDYGVSNTGYVDEDQTDEYVASDTGYDGNMSNYLSSEPNEETNNEQYRQSYVSEDDARQAFLEYADKKCCYSTGPAKEMDNLNFQAFNTYKYCLETFTESRDCKWKCVPYSDGDVDGPENGTSPDPWKIRVDPPNLYEKDKQKVVVPHTSTVQVKTVSETSILNNYIFVFLADQNSEFPSERFNKVTGDIVLEDEQSWLSPITDFVDQSINEASQNAIYEHQNELTSCQILRQRHSIEWLPLTQVDYNWKGKNYHYFVYGKENRAYTNNYPKSCCCVLM